MTVKDSNTWLPLKRVALHILLLMAVYALCRAGFLAFNAAAFTDLGARTLLHYFINGLRYDLSALFFLNAPYMLLLLLPLPLWRSGWRWVAPLAQVLFIAVNAAALLFEASDWIYYRFNLRRATADVLDMIGRQGDFAQQLPQLLRHYWYVPLAWLALVALLVFFSKKIIRATPLHCAPQQTNRWLLQRTGMLAATAILIIVGIRGGLQRVPLSTRSALTIAPPAHVPLVVNTPFSIIRSYSSPALEELQFMPMEEAAAIVRPVKQYKHGQPFRRKNVVVIIVESLSVEFTALGRKSYTPFLDSLMQRSLVCTRAFANAQRSAEGIPAIIAGLPALMDEPFITSLYGTNKITALPQLLKGEGYNSAFFHGGTNGTMSFDAFAGAAGYDKYYGRREYGNERDYDGTWGIWDEPFLQYSAAQISGMRQPFFASVFTLNTHQPYKLPEQYKGKFPKGPLEIEETFGYTDNALRRFFATAATQPWFANTLFVITADHCAPVSEGGYYGHYMGHLSIPIIFYAPGDTALRGATAVPAQQTDILPSVMDYLCYSAPFYAFGNSIFQHDGPHWAGGNIFSGVYFLYEHDYALIASDTAATGFHAFPTDSMLRDNLLGTRRGEAQQYLHRLKAIRQVYNHDMIHDRLYYTAPGR